jgi:hypothetical protein
VVFNTTGAKTLTATYSGDANYAGSSDTEGHTVSSGTAATTTTIADTPDPSTPGQAVGVSVTVSGAGGTPSGMVTITGADTNCTITLSGGIGSCNVVFTAAGARTLTATYSGDSNYTGSSGTANHTVSTGTVSTTTTIADAPDPSTPGLAVGVSVTVIGAGGTPSGMVTITGADTNCTITLSGGIGSCNVVFTTAGARALTATYSGDANYAGSSDTASHTVSKVSPISTIITADTPDPSTPGQSVTVSVTVSGAGAAPTGTVAITGAYTNCTITLSGGIGSCNVVFNTAGAETLTATYNGDANYAGSSANTSHSVKYATTTTITSDNPDPSTIGPLLVTVSVTVIGAGGTPSETVAITGANTNCNITLVGGSGSCTVTFSAAGTFTLTATYNGDDYYLVSQDTETHIVN